MSTNLEQIRWAFNLKNWRPSLEDLLKATSCIQREEKDRLAKFVFRDDFNASLIGRLLMRKFVNETTGIDYASIVFGRDLKGKPYIIKNETTIQNVDFNVSHQGSFSVLAGVVQKNDSKCQTKIGVDVMKVEYTGGKTLEEFFRIMTRNFSTKEWESIKKSSVEKEKLKTFMRHWCLKESYVKNVGVGITVDLQKISFSTKDELEQSKVLTNTCLDVDGVRQHKWQFEESLLDSEHIVAVALENPKEYLPKSFEIISFEQLLENSSPLLEYDQEYCQNILAKKYK